ncbi:hypothetical protein Pcinc_015751 [Petrolisthes cinctipes]|uniref:Uncharacterized protein n=1 Tax=Petrolisthes cinctipes TaxID=88211 RepID=A0AAE1FV23_PETCI|nr:hypothetical protein Pcinc_015751 [Petrolisthes cinctipes]
MGILTGIKGDQFTTAFTGISPTTRPLTREDLYGQQQQGLPDGFLQGPGGLMHRPGVHSPTEMRGGVMVTTSGMVKSLDRPRQTSACTVQGSFTAGLSCTTKKGLHLFGT